MAASDPPVSEQITDAVTQANVKVVAESPAMAMGNLFVATGQALGNAAHWGNTGQQNATMISQAATTMGVTSLYSIDTATTTDSVVQLIQAVQ